MGKRWVQRMMWGIAFGVALVANPFFACRSEDEFDYDEGEMRAFVLGDWQGTLTIDGQAVPFSLVLEQSSAESPGLEPTSAELTPQCASRSFVAPAEACDSMTSMPLAGAMTAEAAALSGAVTGDAWAGATLDSVQLDLTLADDTGLSGSLYRDGLANGSVWRVDPATGRNGQVGTFTLERP